jgi:hypothetical protein
VPRREVLGVRPAGVPAGAGDAGEVVAGVEAQAGDHHVGVVGVGVDGDPAAEAGFAPVFELAGDHRRVEQAGGVEDVADGAGAVVALGEEAGVAAAPHVGPPVDAVGRLDQGPHRRRGAGRGDRAAVEEGGAAGPAGASFPGRARDAFGLGPGDRGPSGRRGSGKRPERPCNGERRPCLLRDSLRDVSKRRTVSRPAPNTAAPTGRR